MVIVVAIVVDVEGTCTIYHRLHMSVFFRLLLLLISPWLSTLARLDDLLDFSSIILGVIDVYTWQDRFQNSFCLLQTLFKRFDVLRSRVSPSVRGLVIGAIYQDESAMIARILA